MTNQEKNVPELRFPEFDGEWEENKINKFLKESIIVGSKGNKAKKLTVKLWGKGVVPKKEVHRGSNNTQYYIRKKGQLMYGKLDFLNCAFGIVPYELDGYESTIDSPAFDIIAGEPKFILEKIKQKSFYKKYGERANGSRKAKRINQNDFLDMTIYSPKYFEQKKIGEFFSKLDRQIELEEQKLSLLEEQKKGYMQKIFSQELRFKDEKGNEYPEWEEKKLGDILERGNKDKVNEIGKYRRLTISLHGKGLYEVKQERKTKDTRPFYQRFEGELIIGKQNFFNGSIAIVTREFNDFICSNAIMSYKISNHMNRKYLLEYLLQNDFLRKNEYLADGTGQKELSEKKFEELDIKLPNSINEQQKIGVFLERLDNLIEKQSNKLELLKQRKKSFLQKMFV